MCLACHLDVVKTVLVWLLFPDDAVSSCYLGFQCLAEAAAVNPGCSLRGVCAAACDVGPRAARAPGLPPAEPPIPAGHTHHASVKPRHGTESASSPG